MIIFCSSVEDVSRLLTFCSSLTKSFKLFFNKSSFKFILDAEMRMSFLFPVTVKEKKDKKENNMFIMYLETRDK